MLTFILTMKTSGNTAKPPSSTLLAIITTRVRTCPVSSARVYNIFLYITVRCQRNHGMKLRMFSLFLCDGFHDDLCQQGGTFSCRMDAVALHDDVDVSVVGRTEC